MPLTLRTIANGGEVMAAYLIAQVKIRDPDIYKQYAARTPPIIAKFGGRVLARAGSIEVLEGDEQQRRVVVIEFPSIDAAREFYSSPEYQLAREIRLPVSEAQFLIVDGVK
jgi:uncharacterized protein (DUF1330 family)